MKSKLKSWISIVTVSGTLAAFSPSACRAEVYVYYLDSSGNVVHPGGHVHSEVAVPVLIDDSTIANVMVYSDDATNDHIGTITVSGQQHTQAINLYVAKTRIAPELIYTQASTQAAAVNLNGVVVTDPPNRTVHLKAFVTGNVTGSITVSHLETLQALGQLQSRIKSESGGHFIVRAGSTNANVEYMEQSAGDIGEVRITSGDASFDILAPNGSIGVVSIGGIFGDISSYPYVTAGTSIDRLEAAGIRAHITAGTGIKFIRTTNSGIKGTITTPTILEQAPGVGGIFDITGNFEPITYLTQGLPANATIRCATWFGDEPGSCTAFLYLQGTNRLAGQIIVNAENNASVGKWYQPVFVMGRRTTRSARMQASRAQARMPRSITKRRRRASAAARSALFRITCTHPTASP